MNLLRIRGLKPALQCKEATGYLDLEGSGNEESELEDNNSDPEAGEAVEALEEGWDGND